MFKWFSKQQSEPENKSGFKLSNRSLKNLNGVHPILQNMVEDAIKISPVDFGILNNGGVRTAEQQNELFKKGASKLDGYNKISKHQKGLAVDLVPYIAGSYRWEMQPCIEIAECMKEIYLQKYNPKYDIVWGGSWMKLQAGLTPEHQMNAYVKNGGRFIDGPHFELIWE